MSATETRPRAGSGGPAGRRTLPNLIVIGAMKCGTSSLHRYLDLHPEVAMAKLKEPDFFVTAAYGNWSRGLDWYASLFDPDAGVRGEASVNYTNLPASAGAAERMHEVAPDARLIYMVRDPIERSISHYLHACANGREKRSIEEAFTDLDERYVRRSRYRWQLEPFIERFGADRILVAAQEDLLDRRAETIRRVFEFAGVDPAFTSPDFDRMWEVSAGKDRKFKLLYGLSRRLGGKAFWGRMGPRARWLVEKVVYRPTRKEVARPSLGTESRRRLAEHLRPDVEGLRELTGQSFDQWSV